MVVVNEKLAGKREDKNATKRAFPPLKNSLAIRKTGMINREERNALMIFIRGYAVVISPSPKA